MSTTAIRMAFETLDAAEPAGAGGSELGDLLGHARRLRGWLDAVDAQLTSRLRELHQTSGGAPAADEHTRCGGVSAAEARRRDRRSKALDAAPSFGDALAEGAISADHVDALANATSRLDDDIANALFGLADDLVADAVRLSPERFGRSVRDLVRRLEADNGLERNRRQRRETFWSRKLNAATGMIEGRYAFHPELAGQVFQGIDREIAAMVAAGTAAGDPEFTERRYDRNRLAAEALGRLVADGHHQVRPVEADITVIVDAESLTTGELDDGSLCETAAGAPLPPESVRRLLCNGRVTPVVVDSRGVVLNAGRTIRHANRHQRRALRAMYRSCAFSGCDVPFQRCEIHHVRPWEHGGQTDLDQMIPICSRHHHVVHEDGWRLDLDPDRTLAIIRPDGQVHATVTPDLVDARGLTDGPPRRRRPAA